MVIKPHCKLSSSSILYISTHLLVGKVCGVWADGSHESPAQFPLLGPELRGPADIAPQVHPVLLGHQRQQLPHKPLPRSPARHTHMTEGEEHTCWEVLLHQQYTLKISWQKLRSILAYNALWLHLPLVMLRSCTNFIYAMYRYQRACMFFKFNFPIAW